MSFSLFLFIVIYIKLIVLLHYVLKLIPLVVWNGTIKLLESLLVCAAVVHV